MAIRVETLTGERLVDALPALAWLRIAVFRDWPYLYDGTLDYEKRYVETFAASEHAVVVAAFDGADIVGCATASPLLGHADAFASAFRTATYDPAQLFYFGESVLLASHRGRGIGHAFFDHREAQARKIGGYAYTTFCGVIRPLDHLLRPSGYVPLDAFWRKRGYEKVDGVVGSFSWRDIDQPSETSKPMQFWIRSLSGPLA
jgi:GNAT superfamily N-acetyltransferase